MYKFKSSKKFRLSEALAGLTAVLLAASALAGCAAQGSDGEVTTGRDEVSQTESHDDAVNETGGFGADEEKNTDPDSEPYPYDAQYEIVLYSLPTILRLETGEYYSANADGSATYTMSSTGNLEDGISKITGGLELLGEVEYYEEYPFDRCPSDAIATNGGRLMIGSTVYYSPDDGSVTVVLPQGYENEDSLIIGYKLFRDDYYSTEEAQTEARSESVRNVESYKELVKTVDIAPPGQEIYLRVPAKRSTEDILIDQQSPIVICNGKVYTPSETPPIIADTPEEANALLEDMISDFTFVGEVHYAVAKLDFEDYTDTDIAANALSEGTLIYMNGDGSEIVAARKFPRRTADGYNAAFVYSYSDELAAYQP